MLFLSSVVYEVLANRRAGTQNSRCRKWTDAAAVAAAKKMKAFAVSRAEMRSCATTNGRGRRGRRRSLEELDGRTRTAAVGRSAGRARCGGPLFGRTRGDIAICPNPNPNSEIGSLLLLLRPGLWALALSLSLPFLPSVSRLSPPFFAPGMKS